MRWKRILYFIILPTICFTSTVQKRRSEVHNKIAALKYTHVQSNQNRNMAPVPVVLWHGMGDYCCNSLMNSVKMFLEENIPHVYVKSVQIGNTMLDDIKNSYLMNVNEQVENVCQQILFDPFLQYGYNSIGFSQGAQFLRAVAQRCPHPKMKNLISFGGQHQGVYGIPHCSSNSSTFCDKVRKLVSYGAYTEWIQNHVVQAEYWHDPLNEDEYRKTSIFLSDINNERTKNNTYKKNLSQLDNLVLVKFTNDTMVDPKESEWFGFYKPGQANKIYSLLESPLYREDWLGLKQMDTEGKLHFLSFAGEHIQIDWDWFLKNIIERFLK